MSARRLVPWVLLMAALVTALVVGARSGSDDRTVEARVERIAEQLRCPTCQGLSVADSPSSTARAIRDDVRRRVEAGETDSQIKSAYAERYGEWILLRTPSSGVGTFVWAVPIAALLAGAGFVLLAFRRWRREPELHATDDDERLVADARRRSTERAP